MTLKRRRLRLNCKRLQPFFFLGYSYGQAVETSFLPTHGVKSRSCMPRSKGERLLLSLSLLHTYTHTPNCTDSLSFFSLSFISTHRLWFSSPLSPSQYLISRFPFSFLHTHTHTLLLSFSLSKYLLTLSLSFSHTLFKASAHSLSPLSSLIYYFLPAYFFASMQQKKYQRKEKQCIFIKDFFCSSCLGKRFSRQRDAERSV